PENVVAYHRETLFGELDPHRAEALRILREVHRIDGVILARRTSHGQDDPALGAPARTGFDVLYRKDVRSGVDVDRRWDHQADVRGRVDRVLHGVLPTRSGLR